MTSSMRDVACKTLVPKLNGLSLIKTGNDDDLRGTSGRLNGIKFINPAIYVEKFDLSVPLSQDYSEGDGKYNGQTINGKTLNAKPIRHRNGAGDQLPPPLSQSSSTCESCEILSDENQNNYVDFPKFSPVKNSEICSFISFHSTSAEEFTNPVKPARKLFHRSYSDIDRSSALSFYGREEYSNEQCLSMEEPRRYYTSLSVTSFTSTFPEENIQKKIVNALSDHGNIHSVTVKNQVVPLPQNWERLIAIEDLAWFRWYISKLEQERDKKKAKKILEMKKKEDEDTQRERKLHRQKLEEERWEKKCKEEAARRKEIARKHNLEMEARRKEEEEYQKVLMLRKQILEEEWRKRMREENVRKRENTRKLEAEKKKGPEKTRIEQSRLAWHRKKDLEKKEQKMKEEKCKQKQEEEKRLRTQMNEKAFEAWLQLAKNRPKPMSVAIKDHKGRSDPMLARLNWNPVPWKGLVEEIPGVQEKKNLLRVPCRTRSECSKHARSVSHWEAG